MINATMRTIVFARAHQENLTASVGLLLLRIGFGGVLLAGHGWGKLTGFGKMAPLFPDPLGLGSNVSLALAVFAEVFCAAAVILGFFTRLAVIPIAVTMLVAFGIVHAADPFANKELALLYLIPMVTLLFTGAGRFSADAGLARQTQRR
jgi:putative oxidoreductase